MTPIGIWIFLHHNLPLGIVKSVTLNELGESTSAVIMKGKTRELTTRHVTNLIPLLKRDKNLTNDDSLVDVSSADSPSEDESHVSSGRPSRTAAKVARDKIRKFYN